MLIKNNNIVSLSFARFLTTFQFCNNLFYLFHFRLFGCMCSGCNQIISPTELVMKALQYVYHIDCFKCHECGDKLEKGDEFLLKDDKLYCSSDFNVAEQRSDSKNSFWQVRIFLKSITNFMGKYLYRSLIKKDTPTQVFSCEFCEIFKDTYFEEHLWTAAPKTIQKFTNKSGIKSLPPNICLVSRVTSQILRG